VRCCESSRCSDFRIRHDEEFYMSARLFGAAVAAGIVLLAGPSFTQQRPSGQNEGGASTQGRGGPNSFWSINLKSIPLPAAPMIFDTAEQHKIRVVVLAKGFAHPWSLAFLPDGDMLVTERDGKLRIVRRGVLDPEPVAGVPAVQVTSLWGLMDIALHPQFAQNKQVYLSYLKPLGNGPRTLAIARGRFEGKALTEVKDVFVAAPPIAGPSRIAFGLDGTLFVTTTTDDVRSQDPNEYSGKVLRLRDDGSVPPDNPFVGRSGYRPEIYSLGHRSQVGLAVHPETGAVWSTEHGRMGGDEMNVILPGRNYGFPTVSYGRNYDGARTSDKPWQDGFEQPIVYWVPSIAPAGLAFYTADRFPTWKGNVFVGGLQRGRIAHTGRLERVVFNRRGEEIRRESLLTELRKRVRDVRQGPDGLLYLLVEDDVAGDGGETALLRIEPASE
jgi:glucose/arabinose dehydrogenase